MQSDDSLNQSALLKSFSAYSDDSISDIEIIKSVSVKQNDHCSPMSKAVNVLMNHKIKNKIPMSGAVDVAKLLNNQSPVGLLPENKDILKKSAKMRFNREFIMLCSKCNKLCDENNVCRKCKCVVEKKTIKFRS